jgi:hypothetical protein
MEESSANITSSSAKIFASLFFYFSILISLYWSAFGTMITMLISSIVISLGLTIPIGFAIISGKKYLNFNPKKIIYKMPISAFIASFILSIIVELYSILHLIIANPSGDAALGPFLWPFFAIGYILGITFLSFLISIGIYQFDKTKNKIWKYILYIALVIPYIFVMIEIIS